MIKITNMFTLGLESLFFCPIFDLLHVQVHIEDVVDWVDAEYNANKWVPFQE